MRRTADGIIDGVKITGANLALMTGGNHGMFDLASRYRADGMTAYVRFARARVCIGGICGFARARASAAQGFTAARHQREVGAGYFDAVNNAVSGAALSALSGSTEDAQFSGK